MLHKEASEVLFTKLTGCSNIKVSDVFRVIGYFPLYEILNKYATDLGRNGFTIERSFETVSKD